MRSFRLLIILAVLIVPPATGRENAPQHHIDHQQSLVGDDQTICIIGDSGTGDANALAVAHALETMDCSQIRILGDVVYPSGIDSPDDPRLQQRLLAPYRFFLDREIPLFLVLGNHDHKSNANAWLDVAIAHPAIYFPNFYYSENWGDVCFFSLDTSYYDKLYFLHKRHTQTEWLRQALSNQAGRCRFSVAIGHHPYRSSGSHGNADWLLDWFLEDELIGAVDLYLAGHDHNLADEGVANGTRLLVSGSAGLRSRLKKPSEDRRFAAAEHGFITLRFQRGDDGTLTGLYRIYTLKPDGSGGYSELKEAWSGRIAGSGVRIPGHRRIETDSSGNRRP